MNCSKHEGRCDQILVHPIGDYPLNRIGPDGVFAVVDRCGETLACYRVIGSDALPGGFRELHCAIAPGSAGVADMAARWALEADTTRALASLSAMLADRDAMMREWVRQQDAGEPFDPRADVVAENIALRREVNRLRDAARYGLEHDDGSEPWWDDLRVVLGSAPEENG